MVYCATINSCGTKVVFFLCSYSLSGTRLFKMLLPFILMLAVILVTLGNSWHGKKRFFLLVSLKNTVTCYGARLKANPGTERKLPLPLPLVTESIFISVTCRSVFFSGKQTLLKRAIPRLEITIVFPFVILFCKDPYRYKLTLLVCFLSSNSISITLISESFYRECKLMVTIYFKHGMAVKIDLAVNVDVEKVTYFSFFRFKQKIEHNLMALVSKSAILLHSQSYSQKLSYNGAISCIVIRLALEDEIGAVVNCYTYRLVSVNNAIYIQKSPQDLDHRILLLQAIDRSLLDFQEEAAFGAVNITADYHSY
ncbi:hypothetical protein EDC94DRAFT_583277 [Helicostylum pulchrum]|nr:hypothetical protein EDC94DRAFT_583277 [Helicostylum pulchrum]